MTPDEYCQDKAAQSGSSFYYSFLFLPPERRRGITALYAFCREVDDVVDECHDPLIARTKLAWWRNEVAAIYGCSTSASIEQSSRLRGANVRESGAVPSSTGVASVSGAASPDGFTASPSDGAPQHPVAKALVPVVRAFGLPQQDLLEIIDGMAMDLDQHRYADFAALREYCRKVAGVVGLLSARIFGHTHADTLKYAENLGLAFQLTNIIRDIGEDARRDRVYLPQIELDQYQVTVADILHGKESDGFKRLMAFQIERAQDFYRAAFALLPTQDRKAQRAGLIMAAIYRTLLDEIQADGCRVMTHRTSLTPLRKFWLAWKTWITA